MIVHLWLLYDVFNYILNHNCVAIFSDDSSSFTSSIENTVNWCFKESIYATLIVLFMFPSICLLYFFLYYTIKYVKNGIYYFFERYYFPCITRHCHNIYYCFVFLTCCLSQASRNHYLGNARRRGADKSNLSQEERKKLVKFSNGNCPLCLDEKIDLILTQGCNHGCCINCLKNYLMTDLKDISKYPRHCFYPQCQTLIQYTNVEYVLDGENLNEYDRMYTKSTDNDTEMIVECNTNKTK